MVRKAKDLGPRLEALLDERDHLRIKVSLAEEHDAHGEVFAMRRRLVQLDKEILQRWDMSDAQGA